MLLCLSQRTHHKANVSVCGGAPTLVTEKHVRLTTMHNRQHNDAKVTSLCSLLDMPEKLPNGIAEQKQQSNLHMQGDLLISKLAVWVSCSGNRA